MPMTVRGQTGFLKVGYQSAAELARWTLVYGFVPDAQPPRPANAWTLTMALKEVDLFWLSREQFDIVLPIGERTWRFRAVDFRLPDCATCEFTIQGEGRPEIR